MRTRLALSLPLLFLLSCTPESARLPAGTWTGGLTPMNHPEMETPVRYRVDYVEDTLTLDLVGPNDSVMPTRNTRLAEDTLYFAFDEPDDGVTLQCALAGGPAEGFAGRCSDPSGKWARFTMQPPTSGTDTGI